jgi:ATP-binding cassette, subfamily B, heavy metal transporter
VMVTAFVGYSWVVNNEQQESNIAANDADDLEKGNVSDMLLNIDSIKYYGKEAEVQDRYEKLARKTKEATVKNWSYGRKLDLGQQAILGIGTITTLALPLWSFYSGKITIGTVVFIYTAFGNLMGPIFGFAFAIRGFYRTMAEFESLFKYYKVDQHVKDTKGARKLQVKEGRVKFNNVQFGYGEQNILKDFCLDMPARTSVALVGPSGAGKSTIVKLLYRLYDVTSGTVSIDGKDIAKVEQSSLRSQLSIVPQECMLFDDTIYNNIKFSRPGATRKQVMQAIKFAQLDKIIEKFPDKEKTIVGERGVRLSGGEKQRVSIARALLADKKILVLDEATSALDSHTEHEIQKALEKLMEGRTTIVIAHRLSTIMGCDKIVVMDDGKIVEEGTHEGLLSLKGTYADLWNLQSGPKTGLT